MKDKEIKKKTLFLLLIIITFIILVISWQFYLKIFPKEKKEEGIFKEIKKEIFNFEKNFEDIFREMKGFRFFNLEKPTENESEKTLTNKEIEKLKEKVLEYVNQKNNEKRENKK